MKIADKSVVVTGGASGIGLALARRFRAEGARGIVLADLQEDALLKASGEIDALAVPCDVADETDIKRLVAAAEDAFGPSTRSSPMPGSRAWAASMRRMRSGGRTGTST